MSDSFNLPFIGMKSCNEIDDSIESLLLSLAQLDNCFIDFSSQELIVYYNTCGNDIMICGLLINMVDEPHHHTPVRFVELGEL